MHRASVWPLTALFLTTVEHGAATEHIRVDLTAQSSPLSGIKRFADLRNY
jgi:hypothetical protein